MIDKRDKTPQRARESLTSSFHCQAPHFSSSQHARMHSPALPPPRGRTSPNPKHCPTSSLGFHVASSHALLRASASPSDVITPSFFFSFPRDTRCWPCHRRGAWSEHQAGTPSFSIPSRTSFPWRHPTSRRYCQVMHSESSQQDQRVAMEELAETNQRLQLTVDERQSRVDILAGKECEWIQWHATSESHVRNAGAQVWL